MPSSQVLKIELRDGGRREKPAVRLFGDVGRGEFKWHGGALAPNGKIYAVPCCARQVLEIDPDTEELSLLPDDLGETRSKWYGGIIAGDGNMYCIPFRAQAVLRVRTADRRCDLLGGPFASARPSRGNLYGWHGGLLGPDGNVYGFPAHATSVLKIVVATGEVVELGGPLEEQNNGGRYKWGGGCVGPDGCIYGIPSDATSVLKIRPADGTVSTFGALPNTKNKWQVSPVVCLEGTSPPAVADSPGPSRMPPEDSLLLVLGRRPRPRRPHLRHTLRQCQRPHHRHGERGLQAYRGPRQRAGQVPGRIRLARRNLVRP